MSAVGGMESATLERAVLAAALFDQQAALRVAEEISERDFADSTRRAIFRAVVSLVEDGKGADAISLRGWFEERGSWNRDLEVLVATLDADLPDLYRVETYCEQLRGLTARRRVWLFADRLSRETEQDGQTGADLLASAMSELEDIAGGQEKRRAVANREEMHRLVSEHLVKPPSQILGLSTGLRDLDRVILGLCPGKLIVVAGRPGMGKSAFGLKLCREVTWRQDGTALLVTLEMGRDEIAFRELAAESGVQCNLILTRLLDDSEKRRIEATLQRGVDARLLVDDTPTITVPEIVFRARREKSRGGLDLLVIDYLNLLGGYRKADTRDQEIGHMTRSLKGLARTLEIPVVLLCQLSRKCEDRADKHPRLADLRESGNIEQDADVVLFPFRPAVYDAGAREDAIELIVEKNRGGETGTIEVKWDGPTMNISDAYPRAAAEIF